MDALSAVAVAVAVAIAPVVMLLGQQAIALMPVVLISLAEARAL